MHSVALDYLAPIPLNISEDCINKCYTESESIICLSLRVFCKYRGDLDKDFFFHSILLSMKPVDRPVSLEREKSVKLAEMPFFLALYRASAYPAFFFFESPEFLSLAF